MLRISEYIINIIMNMLRISASIFMMILMLDPSLDLNLHQIHWIYLRIVFSYYFASIDRPLGGRTGGRAGAKYPLRIGSKARKAD